MDISNCNPSLLEHAELEVIRPRRELFLIEDEESKEDIQIQIENAIEQDIEEIKLEDSEA